MRRDELEAAVPLLVRHYDALVRRMDARRSAQSDKRKVLRRTIIDAYLETHDIKRVATAHGVSPAAVNGILAQAVFTVEKIAKRAAQKRVMLPLVLETPSPQFIYDIDAWAQLRRMTREKAAQELIRIGLDVTSARAAIQAEAAWALMRQMQKWHRPRPGIRV